MALYCWVRQNLRGLYQVLDTFVEHLYLAVLQLLERQVTTVLSVSKRRAGNIAKLSIPAIFSFCFFAEAFTAFF